MNKYRIYKYLIPKNIINKNNNNFKNINKNPINNSHLRIAKFFESADVNIQMNKLKRDLNYCGLLKKFK